MSSPVCDLGEPYLARWGADGAELACFDRGRDPVVMDPVLDLEDAVGGKVCALVRVEPRDYADVAAALGRYSAAQLIGFARRLDPPGRN